ncbi:helix-turn-helix transcriptional regulator [Sphingomonas sp. CJ20]
MISVAELMEAIAYTCTTMRVPYFALTHHVDFRREANAGIRLHNYPEYWEEWFDARGLGRSDPIHRASQRVSMGFAWTSVPGIIALTPEDHLVLEHAARAGIGDGYTVPAHVPGETLGSCSFAVEVGRAFPAELQLPCQLIGGFAFEAARRVTDRRGAAFAQAPILTDRQLDCVLWAARGKTDWEIAVILGISHETVIQHLKHARERYGVQKRALLAVRALFDGLISFTDILRR